jgi:hypothetical protein
MQMSYYGRRLRQTFIKHDFNAALQAAEQERTRKLQSARSQGIDCAPVWHSPSTSLPLPPNLLVPVALHQMVIHHPHALHERIADRRAHKLEAPFQQVFAHLV